MESSLSNNWVESYLEALLDKGGLSGEYQAHITSEKGSKFDADRAVYAKYYVNQILHLDEEGIRNAWSKATSSRQCGEKDVRLEYLSWRVWFLKRKKATVKNDEAGIHADSVGGSEDSHEASDDDDLSTGNSPRSPLVEVSAGNRLCTDTPESGTIGGAAVPTVHSQLPAVRVNRVQFNEALTAEKDEPTSVLSETLGSRFNGLYIVLISLHGLVRGDSMELGRDPDTGGQVKYVVELAKALALMPSVGRVELLTRQILDPKVDKSYGEPEECLVPGDGLSGPLGGAYIVRLPCGPNNKYIRKEMLWPYVREFADRAIVHIRSMLSALSKTGHPCELYAVHGHYADAGECASLIASTLDVDMLMTGHSLGRNKLEHLRSSGTMTRDEIEASYMISRRIEAEERALDSSLITFTSTHQEVEQQWGLYDGYDADPNGLNRTLRSRPQAGRVFTQMRVIPPGLDFSSLKVDLPEDPVVKELKLIRAAGSANGHGPMPTSHAVESPSFQMSDDDSAPSPHEISRLRGGVMVAEDPPIWQEVFRFLRNPRKPVVLAMSRPDAKKNITTLVQAFATNEALRSIANLVLIMGNRDNIDSMAAGSAKVLTQVLKLIDAYDLYGSVAYPKHHSQADISDIYHLAFHTRGVFTNVALQEPFGLTVIEAAAHGVPTVATKNGGPVDIMATLHHGVVVDPNNPQEISAQLLRILMDAHTWEAMSANARSNINAYSWPSHCIKYLESVDAEKKWNLLHKRQLYTHSGFWDAESLGISSKVVDVSEVAPSSQSQLELDISRACTAPHEVPVIPLPFIRTVSNMSSDDLSILEPHTPVGLSPLTRGFAAHSRQRFIVVAMDGSFMSGAVCRALFELHEAAVDAKEGDKLGLAVASMLGYDDTCKYLKALDLDLNILDFIVCNSGADVWLRGCHNTWVPDAAYESHIDFRWEHQSLARMLRKWKNNPRTGVRSMDVEESLLSKLPEEEKGLHPQHLTMQLDAHTRERLVQCVNSGKQLVAAGHKYPATVIMERINRRLRKCAFRVNTTLQMVPRSNGWLSVIHFTPLRASRPLALRYLANKFGITMEHMTLLVFPRTPAKLVSDSYQLPGYTSDFPDLVAGWQRVWTVFPLNRSLTMQRSISTEYQEKSPVLEDSDELSPILKLVATVGADEYGSRVNTAVSGEQVIQGSADWDIRS